MFIIMTLHLNYVTIVRFLELKNSLKPLEKEKEIKLV